MFEIVAEHGDARVGLIKTPHGTVETPVFLPVATKAVVKTLTPDEAWDAGCRGIIVNALHLYRRGIEYIKQAGGIHNFMRWKGIVVSDSGGFQPIKKFPCKVSDEGVKFSMPDGTVKLFTPEKSMKVQGMLGVDIALSLDDCPSYPYDKKRVALSVDKTIKWASRCQGKGRVAILQGGTFEDERIRCAKAIAKMNFDGFAIGGLCIGEPKEDMHRMVKATIPYLPKNNFRHLMGVGSAEDIIGAIKKGVDIFDSAFPTRNARHGTVFVGKGKINLGRAKVKGDVIQEGCQCYTCRNFSLDYINHLFREKDSLGPRLATIHNLFFTNKIMEEAREKIKEGKL
ncbi:MAG: tRNA guanosine(34) transglycosylase Tgt [Candidatus Thermoplasmatota archaeon]|nr:tRNA guanosine(34) transglycosylase Tgt [Candidatus Thermoplasmatota archaeon]